MPSIYLTVISDPAVIYDGWSIISTAQMPTGYTPGDPVLHYCDCDCCNSGCCPGSGGSGGGGGDFSRVVFH